MQKNDEIGRKEFNILKKKYNRNKMQEDLTNRLQSIFQIKVKEDNLCTAFRTLELKIMAIDQKVQKENQARELFYANWNEEKIKKYIKQVVSVTTQQIQQKVDGQEHVMNTMRYNHDNLCQNMGEEFKTKTGQLQKMQGEFRTKFYQQQIKAKQNIETNKLKLEEVQIKFNQFYGESQRKERDHQIKIDNVWDVIRDIRRSIDEIDPKNKKRIRKERRQSQMKEAIESKEKDNKVDVEVQVNKSRKQKKRMGGHNSTSVLKNGGNLDSSLDHVSIIMKVDHLQNKFKDFTNNMLRESQRILTSRKVIDQDDEQSNGNDISRKKGTKVSRFGRVSINTEQSEVDLAKQKAEEEKERMLGEMKKLYDKVNDLRYKYTHLQENYDIILTKLPRLYQMEASLVSKMEEVDKVKVDLSTINEIKIRYRKIQSGYDDQDRKYISKHTYQADLASLKESIREMQNFVPRYAKQDEVKQAFEFIETKIKDIVVVLTSKFESDKEGAINKTQQIKCLTCDKQAENIPQARKGLSSATLSRSNKKMRSNMPIYVRFKTEDS